MIKFCKQLVGELDYERADRAKPGGAFSTGSKAANSIGLVGGLCAVRRQRDLRVRRLLG